MERLNVNPTRMILTTLKRRLVNGKARPQADERQARPADERLSGAGP